MLFSVHSRNASRGFRGPARARSMRSVVGLAVVAEPNLGSRTVLGPFTPQASRVNFVVALLEPKPVRKLIAPNTTARALIHGKLALDHGAPGREGFAVLQRLNDRAIACLAHAAEMEERAYVSLHPQAKADFLDMARRWRKLAESYQFVERIEDFLDAQGRKRK